MILITNYQYVNITKLDVGQLKSNGE